VQVWKLVRRAPTFALESNRGRGGAVRPATTSASSCGLRFALTVESHLLDAKIMNRFYRPIRRRERFGRTGLPEGARMKRIAESDRSGTGGRTARPPEPVTVGSKRPATRNSQATERKIAEPVVDSERVVRRNLPETQESVDEQAEMRPPSGTRAQRTNCGCATGTALLQVSKKIENSRRRLDSEAITSWRVSDCRWFAGRRGIL